MAPRLSFFGLPKASPTRLLCVFFAGLLTISTGSLAAADDHDDAGEDESGSLYTAQPTVLSVHLGAGTPLGMIGAELEHAVTDWLAVSAGVGAGIAGPQAAATIRVRTTAGLNAYGVSIGGSVGDAKKQDRQYLGATTTDILDDGIWPTVMCTSSAGNRAGGRCAVISESAYQHTRRAACGSASPPNALALLQPP